MNEIVKKYRLQNGMSQGEFAEALGEGGEAVSRVTVSYWENGIQQPRTDWLLDLLERYSDDRSDWRYAFAVDCLRAKSDVFVDVCSLPEAEGER